MALVLVLVNFIPKYLATFRSGLHIFTDFFLCSQIVGIRILVDKCVDMKTLVVLKKRVQSVSSVDRKSIE